MKAICYRQYGGPEVLKIENMPMPKPKDNQVLIKVMAAEITKGDCELRSFQFPVKWFSWALRLVWGIRKPRRPILGGYFSGEIVELGSKVERFSVGDRVFGSCGLSMGAYGSYLCLNGSNTISKFASEIPWEQAAATPLGGLNALHFINKGKIRPGTKLLVNGAGGSIGTFAIQIAKLRGAAVTAVDASHKKEMLMSLGVERFIDYQKEDFHSAGQWDVILDMVASTDLRHCLESLNEGGRYITANPNLSKMLFTSRLTKKSNKKVIFSFAEESQEELDSLAKMLSGGQIKAIVDRCFAPENIIEAHRMVESEARLGTLVLIH